MRVAKRWLVIGMFVAIGAMWFASRALLALGGATRSDAWPFVVAFAIGGLAAGAVIARHATVRAWCEPIIATVLALAFFLVVARAGRDTSNSVVGPISIMSTAQLVLTCVCAIAGAYGGALAGRRISAPPATAAIIVLSGLLMNGVMMLLLGAMAALLGTHKLTGGFVPLVFVAPALAGFATQAVVAARRPWTCASGGLLLLLLFVQEDRDRSISGAALAIGALTLLGWIGARIAVRVYRERWIAPAVSVPEAQAIER